MSIRRPYNGLLGLSVMIIATISIASAQALPPKEMAELLTALKDKGLTTIQKNQLVGSVYSGVVEVNDVEEVDRYDGKGNKIKSTAARIMVEVGGYARRFILALETVDLDKASKLRKGDNVSVFGKLVRFSVHNSGYSNVPDTEWAVFEQVVIGAK